MSSIDFITMYSSPIREDNIISKIGVNAWAILCVIRSCCDINSGKSVVSYTDFQEKTGLSRASVAKSLKKLIEDGLIRTVSEKIETSKGMKTSKYYIIDKILVPSGDDGSITKVDIRYSPASFFKDRSEIDGFIKNSNYIISSSNINIENMTNCNVVIVTSTEEVNRFIEKARAAQKKNRS